MTKTSKVSKKGQIVIPAELRRKMGLTPGTRVAVMETERGVEVQPLNRDFVYQFAGMLSGKGGDTLGELLRERRRDREREEADF